MEGGLCERLKIDPLILNFPFIYTHIYPFSSKYYCSIADYLLLFEYACCATCYLPEQLVDEVEDDGSGSLYFISAIIISFHDIIYVCLLVCVYLHSLQTCMYVLVYMLSICKLYTDRHTQPYLPFIAYVTLRYVFIYIHSLFLKKRNLSVMLL